MKQPDLPADDDEDYIPDELVGTPEARAVNGLDRRRWLKLGGLGALAAASGGVGYYWHTQVPLLDFDGRYAHATTAHPPVIHQIVAAANQLQDKPYKPGGGHQVLYDNGFDCSGSISHILYRVGLMLRPLNSQGFASYGLNGPGAYLTLFVRPGQHVFMSVCGLRFDTSGGARGEGPRWRSAARDAEGFTNRHPHGL